MTSSIRPGTATFIVNGVLHKKCTACKKALDVKDFGSHANSNGIRYYRSKCRRYSVKYQRAHSSTEKAKQRRRRYEAKRSYGITPDEFDLLFERAKNSCEICGGKDRLSIDHCHTLGAVRGVLCRRCNLGLGAFDDDPTRLLSASSYLDRGTMFERRDGRRIRACEDDKKNIPS